MIAGIYFIVFVGIDFIVFVLDPTTDPIADVSANLGFVRQK